MARNSLWILIVFLFFGCSQHGGDYITLVGIDSLLAEEMPDSALHQIERLNPDGFDNKALAYFQLLQTQALYKVYQPVNSDSVINQAIGYYEQSHDKEKLARAYFYKACIYTDLNRHKEALDLLKRAAIMAEELDNKILLHNIIFYLGIVNSMYNEPELALSYFQKALALSRQTGKTNHLVFDYERLAMCYGELGNKDSARYYIEKGMNMTEGLPRSQEVDKWHIWITLANNYIDLAPEKARLFYEKSVAIKPHASAYWGLAMIRLQAHDTLGAVQLFTQGAAINDFLEAKIMNLSELSRIEQEQGHYKRANELLQEAQMLKDSMARKQQDDNVRARQLMFDRQMEQRQAREQLIYALMVVVVVTVLGGLAVWLLVVRKAKAERLAKTVEVRAEAGELRRGELEQEVHSREKALRSATRRLERMEKALRETQKEKRANEKSLSNGHRLYTSLLAGEPVRKWEHGDCTDFINYFRQMDRPFAERTDRTSRRLTTNEHLYVILSYMGLSDGHIAQSMGLSEGAMRTMKSRINQKRIS